jgi:hypothetical protein
VAEPFTEAARRKIEQTTGNQWIGRARQGLHHAQSTARSNSAATIFCVTSKLSDSRMPERSAISRRLCFPSDWLSTLLLRIIHSDVDQNRGSERFRFVRHEDLSRNPVEAFV